MFLKEISRSLLIGMTEIIFYFNSRILKQSRIQNNAIPNGFLKSTFKLFSGQEPLQQPDPEHVPHGAR